MYVFHSVVYYSFQLSFARAKVALGQFNLDVSYTPSFFQSVKLCEFFMQHVTSRCFVSIVDNLTIGEYDDIVLNFKR